MLAIAGRVHSFKAKYTAGASGTLSFTGASAKETGSLTISLNGRVTY